LPQRGTYGRVAFAIHKAQKALRGKARYMLCVRVVQPGSSERRVMLMRVRNHSALLIWREERAAVLRRIHNACGAGEGSAYGSIDIR